MKYLNNYFSTSAVNRDVFKKYSESKFFSKASLILENPDIDDILGLYKAQKGMGNILGEKNNYLLVNFILDLNSGDIYIWNSLFSNIKSAYVDIFNKYPELNNNKINEKFILSGSGFLNIEQDKLRGDDLTNSSTVRTTITNFSNEELEELFYNFPLLDVYFDNIDVFAKKVIEDLFYKKKFQDYSNAKYNTYILKDFLKKYDNDAYEKLVYLF